MKKELQLKLYEDYPKIFRQKDMSPQETAMCWGIACGDGWYDLLHDLCGEIQNHCENINRRRSYNRDEFTCEAVQVKEKFGALCFYTYGSDDYIDGLVSMAEAVSLRTCSECGNKSIKNKTSRGWIHTLCKDCESDRLTEAIDCRQLKLNFGEQK